jgi:putative addiction module component (TIGR02574 family)
MVQTIDMEAIRKLSRAQRWRLIVQIWDTLAEDNLELPLTDKTKSEIERRVKEIQDNPDAGVSHEDMLKWLRSRTDAPRRDVVVD